MSLLVAKYDLRPEQDGVPVPPDQLDRYRYTHYFKGPSCVCAFIKGDGSVTEAKMGLAQLVRQPPNADCIGRYVAICATQECGYFGALIRPLLLKIRSRLTINTRSLSGTLFRPSRADDRGIL